MTATVCNDNSFELIEKYKQILKDCTNIDTSPDELKVIDNIDTSPDELKVIDNILFRLE